MQSVYPVIVIFNVSLEKSLSYQTLIKRNDIESFLVYDNSPENYVQEQCEIPHGATYVRDTSNGGLPKAYNLAAQIAKEKHIARILLLDQDTAFPSDAWQAYLDNIDFKGMTAPSMITQRGQSFSPVNIKGFLPHAMSQVSPTTYSLFDCAFVNSGCCIPTELFIKAGGYNDKVKLDFADYQFQLNLRKICPIVQVLHVQAIQNFSNESHDYERLLQRFMLYLESAHFCCFDSFLQYFKHYYEVFHHAVALSLRTRKISFISKYFTIFLLNYKK